MIVIISIRKLKLKLNNVLANESFKKYDSN